MKRKLEEEKEEKEQKEEKEEKEEEVSPSTTSGGDGGNTSTPQKRMLPGYLDTSDDQPPLYLPPEFIRSIYETSKKPVIVLRDIRQAKESVILVPGSSEDKHGTCRLVESKATEVAGTETKAQTETKTPPASQGTQVTQVQGIELLIHRKDGKETELQRLTWLAAALDTLDPTLESVAVSHYFDLPPKASRKRWDARLKIFKTWMNKRTKPCKVVVYEGAAPPRPSVENKEQQDTSGKRTTGTVAPKKARFV